MPDIGLLTADLWEELSSIKISLTHSVSDESREIVKGWLSELPRPIVLLHGRGISFQQAKNIPDVDMEMACRYLLDHTDGSVIFLDWNESAPKIRNSRIRNLGRDMGRATIEQLIALYELSDLLIGIDSGPAHLGRFTEIPTLFVWRKHHPAQFTFPRDRDIHLVPREPFREVAPTFRPIYNTLEVPGATVSGKEIGRIAKRILDGPRYLMADRIGADMQLQQYILDWTYGGRSNQSTFIDRDKTFDQVARHLAGTRNFRMVETGTARRAEDWSGAGYSTYLFGRLAKLCDGSLISVDIEPAKCNFSTLQTLPFSDHVSIVNEDSVSFLSRFEEPIDVLYLDSMDLGVSGYVKHALAEAQAGFGNVKPGGYILIDDTAYEAGRYHGKGARAVPWLQENGCQIAWSGHQTLLRKT